MVPWYTQVPEFLGPSITAYQCIQGPRRNQMGECSNCIRIRITLEGFIKGLFTKGWEGKGKPREIMQLHRAGNARAVPCSLAQKGGTFPMMWLAPRTPRQRSVWKGPPWEVVIYNLWLWVQPIWDKSKGVRRMNTLTSLASFSLIYQGSFSARDNQIRPPRGQGSPLRSASWGRIEKCGGWFWREQWKKQGILQR